MIEVDVIGVGKVVVVSCWRGKERVGRVRVSTSAVSRWMVVMVFSVI